MTRWFLIGLAAIVLSGCSDSGSDSASENPVKSGPAGTADAAGQADDAMLPREGPGDPALTYDVVAQDPAKYRGKRVTWAFTSMSADGKRMMCALDRDQALGPNHKGIYVVEFASDEIVGDVFSAAAFTPGCTMTGTVAGAVDQFLVVTGSDGVAQESVPKVSVPLLLFPIHAIPGAADGRN